MALFSIDIEKYYNEVEQMGRKPKGIFCIQYPVYCIHASICDETVDPMENVDRTIVSFINQNPDLKANQIAGLMGTSKALVEQRTAKLYKDGILHVVNGTSILTEHGNEVYEQRSALRQHKRSYDFYIDGVTLQPLPRIFYTAYRSYLISEHESYIYTNPRTGETRVDRPFGPDIVHTPPDQPTISDNIFSIGLDERESYGIPLGLCKIEEISFTKLTFRVLVSVCKQQAGLVKELLDGYAIYSLSDNRSYYEVLRQNVLPFEGTLKEKIKHLEFKITIPNYFNQTQENIRPIITSNWHEIEKHKHSENSCFRFSTDDLISVANEVFKINYVSEDSIINREDEIEISINRNMLMTSPNRPKLVNDLVRKRDYKILNPDSNNVFLLFLYYTTYDFFVQKVLDLKQEIIELEKGKINLAWIRNSEYQDNYRELLVAAGEFDLLEQLDIEQHMVHLN